MILWFSQWRKRSTSLPHGGENAYCTDIAGVWKKKVRKRSLVVCQMKWSRDRTSERWRGLAHVRDLVQRGPCKHCAGTTEGSTMKCRIKTKQLVVREQWQWDPYACCLCLSFPHCKMKVHAPAGPEGLRELACSWTKAGSPKHKECDEQMRPFPI